MFASLSLAFGLAIIVVNPPLRGPDEISHFLRIHSYARGELIPTTEIDGRKGIFVERELYDQLYFFKDSGEWFAKARNERARYGEIMAEFLLRALEATSASSNSLRRACAQHAASVIGPGLRPAS